jgi:threonyl-tRNA synthetase
VGEDGKTHRPYMVHRALLGALERFFAILIEHFGGAFPLWLAPEQVRVLPLTEKQLEYAESVADALLARDIRVKVDRRSEKVGAKIRDAQLEKVPYMLIVGPREAEQQTVSVRSRSEGDRGAVTLDELTVMLEKENVPAE